MSLQSEQILEEKLVPERFRSVLDDYIFTDKPPLRDDVLNMLEGKKPGIRERKNVAERIVGKIHHLVETFISGIAS